MCLSLSDCLTFDLVIRHQVTTIITISFHSITKRLNHSLMDQILQLGSFNNVLNLDLLGT